MAEDPRGQLFDRKLGALFGVPDVLSTEPTTIQAATPIVGDAQTFIVQTYRQKNGDGRACDTVFLQSVDAAGSVRLVLPPLVTACIARQRDALTKRTRKAAAKVGAATRKARGIEPAFLKTRRKSRSKKGGE